MGLRFQVPGRHCLSSQQNLETLLMRTPRGRGRAATPFLGWVT